MTKRLCAILSSMAIITLWLASYQTPAAGADATPTVAPNRTPLWTFQTQGAVWASPAISKGVVYVGSDDNNFYAVDTASGKLAWKFATAGLVRGRPAVVENSVYFASDDGYLYALDIKSGSLTWKLDIGNAGVKRLLPDNDYNWDYLQSSPTVANGVIYIGSADGYLYAVNAAKGDKKWTVKTGAPIRSTPAVDNGFVYVGSRDGFIYAVDAATGKAVWKFDAHGQYIPVQPSPRVVDGLVYIGGRNYEMYALDAKTGEKKWSFRYKQAWVESSPAIVDGVVYVGSSEDQRLYALDAKTGEKKWEFVTLGYSFSSPAVADGVVYIGHAYPVEAKVETYFYAIDIKAAEAAGYVLPIYAKWRVKIESSLDTSPVKIIGVISSPTVSDGVVYFGGLDGKLYAVSTAE